MFRYLSGVAFVAVLALNCGVAWAADTASADDMMPGCRGWLEKTTADAEPLDILVQGLCVGLVGGVGYAAPGVCAPPDSTNEQALRIVVQYIDARPTRRREAFLKLALEALRRAWPCNR